MNTNEQFFNDLVSSDLKDMFSWTKYVWYLYRALETLYYHHKQGIILCGLSPAEILIDKGTGNVKFRTLRYSSFIT